MARNGGTTLAAAREALSRPDDVQEFAVPRARLLAPLVADSPGRPGVDEQARTVLGPEGELDWPTLARDIDFDCEVACVAGKSARDLSADEASAVIFGYTLLSGWSADESAAHFATSLGPCIVTPDEFDPSNTGLVARVDGEVRSEGSLGEVTRSFAEMIAQASWQDGVLPGDIYVAAPVALEGGPAARRRLEPGQVVELEAEGIGVLRTRLGPPSS